jgi:hypothetical protein
MEVALELFHIETITGLEMGNNFLQIMDCKKLCVKFWSKIRVFDVKKVFIMKKLKHWMHFE